jgi:hypothetical protein
VLSKSSGALTEIMFAAGNLWRQLIMLGKALG